MRVVDFASSARQSIIRTEQRVGLARLDCGDGGNVVGLLFTRDELDAFIQLRFHDLHNPEHLQNDGICPWSPGCG